MVVLVDLMVSRHERFKWKSYYKLPIPKRTFKANAVQMIGRKNKVGNKGAGRVIAAGKGAKAQALKGKLVACMGMGGSYSQHAVVNVEQCMAHHDTTTPEEVASSFVNPLTALEW